MYISATTHYIPLNMNHSIWSGNIDTDLGHCYIPETLRISVQAGISLSQSKPHESNNKNKWVQKIV